MEIPVWRHNLGGPDLQVGREMDFFAFLEPTGPVVAVEGPSLVGLEDDADVRVIGTNGGTGRGPGPVHTLTVVESGPLRLVIPASYTPATIECLGKLWDLGTRAGPGACHGVIRGIIWHKEVLETTEVRKGVYSSEGVGYYEVHQCRPPAR